MEERLELLLGNYADFERELLDRSLYGMLFEIRDWSAFMDELYLTNRRLVNLLTTCRLYIDQIPHTLNEMYPFGDQGGRLKRRFSEEYDRRVGYRALEALRNYVQHRGLLVHRITFERWREDVHSDHPAKATVTPRVDTRKLAEDRKFKASVLAELRALGDFVDLKPLVRDYIEGITAVHATMREMIAADVQEWDHVTHSAIARYAEAFGVDTIGLAAVLVRRGGRYVGRVSIFDDPVKRRRWLERKNRAFPYSRHIVTSEVKQPRPR